MIKKFTLLLILFFMTFNVFSLNLEKLKLPEGFKISIFADELQLPRQISESRNGYIFIGSKKANGKIFALIDKDKYELVIEKWRNKYPEKKIIYKNLFLKYKY